jgi:hypothetical protein
MPDETQDQDPEEAGLTIGGIATTKSALGEESIPSKSSLDGTDMITKNSKENKFLIEITDGDHSGNCYSRFHSNRYFFNFVSSDL